MMGVACGGMGCVVPAAPAAASRVALRVRQQRGGGLAAHTCPAGNPAQKMEQWNRASQDLLRSNLERDPFAVAPALPGPQQQRQQQGEQAVKAKAAPVELSPRPVRQGAPPRVDEPVSFSCAGLACTAQCWWCGVCAPQQEPVRPARALAGPSIVARPETPPCNSLVQVDAVTSDKDAKKKWPKAQGAEDPDYFI